MSPGQLCHLGSRCALSHAVQLAADGDGLELAGVVFTEAGDVCQVTRGVPVTLVPAEDPAGYVVGVQ
jgi:hypothetical protein